MLQIWTEAEERSDKMEIKINREIREYTESMFFGLNLRQFICSILACAAGVPRRRLSVKPRCLARSLSFSRVESETE